MFKTSYTSLQKHCDPPLSLPISDLNIHLAYWPENVATGAWIILKMKDRQIPDGKWIVSEIPNALVFVALIASILSRLGLKNNAHEDGGK